MTNRLVLLASAVGLGMGLGTAAFVPPAFALENICPYQGQRQQTMAHVMHANGEKVTDWARYHCANVGKVAFNAIGPDDARAKPLGVIEGVSWVHAGEAITLPGQPQRTARYTGFIYIIGPGGVSPHPFTRWANDIAPR
ncbi:MAG: hypothetical protein WCF16_10320 [Alphaproteobacteria bacterium]